MTSRHHASLIIAAFGWLVPVLAHGKATDAAVPFVESDDAGVNEGEGDLTVSSPPSSATTSSSNALDVVVQGPRNEAKVLQESAEAVTVIDLRKAKQQTADLGEVLARAPGVSVRRSGGLGSDAILSLNGLQNEQIRTFVDGIPAELAGYPLGIVNIPVNIVERVEIYRGVVPIRFGLDALGGVINVVTTNRNKSYLSGSDQVGSFGVHRFNVSGRYRDDESGFIAGGSAYTDDAKNDYEVDDRMIAQDDGSSVVRRLPLFHNAYHAYGARLQFGIVERPWARRMLVEGFVSNFYQQVQSNSVMTLPYGEVESGELTFGGNLQYEVSLLPKLELELLLNYARRIIDFRDVGELKYRWDGTVIGPLGTARGPVYGEIGAGCGQNEIDCVAANRGFDITTYENLVLGRLGLVAPLHPQHSLRFSVTPQFVTRSRHDFFPRRRNYDLVDTAFQLVTGVEHESSWFDERLSNIVFGKFYWFAPTTQRRVAESGIDPYIREDDRSSDAWGGGDSLRFRFARWLIGKFSYEYTARLPSPEELFGDSRFVKKSEELEAERSHNINLGPRLELNRTPVGNFVVDINAFWRETRDQIVLVANQLFSAYRNVANTRTKGVESSISWQSPSRWVELDSSFTWLDSRNTSTDGPYVPFADMRIPSRPYLFASWGARFHLSDLTRFDDSLDFFYNGRYVHGFMRGWEDIGDPAYKMSIPAQTAHNLGVTYYQVVDFVRYSITLEVDNLFDAALFDVWGMQRPGRSFGLKVTGQL